MQIKGIVFSGKGEGKKFLGMKGYSKKLKKKFGFEPFPGTLNVRVEKQDAKKIKIARENASYIPGFRKNGKLFFGLFAISCKLNDEKCAVLFPKKSSHKNTLEIIAEKNLRKMFCIKDGDKIKIKTI